MKPQPPTLSLKRGAPVYYYRGDHPSALYLGGKVGSYRLLATSPTTLDSGMCVHPNEFPSTVFPAPNEHGVFNPAACTRISLQVDARLKLTVGYVEAGPSTWCAAVMELVVGDNHRSSPVSIRRKHPTLDAALADTLPSLLLELRELANGTDSELQKRHSLPKALYAKTRRFGRKGVYEVISAIPSHIASDILKLLNGAS